MESYKKIYTTNYMETICQNCIEFKNKIDILDAKVTCLEYEIIELKEENKVLKEENKVLKEENKLLKDRIIILEFDKIKFKIITALQDLNSYDKLEIKLEYPTNSYFLSIRYSRNSSNHYIDLNDNVEIVEYKKKILLLYLLNLTEENIKMLNERICKKKAYYNIIEKVILYLKINTNMDVTVTEEIEDEVECWWEY